MSEVVERILAQEDMSEMLMDCLFENIGSVAAERFRKTLADRINEHYVVSDTEVYFVSVGVETVVHITSVDADLHVRMHITTNPVVTFE